MIGISCILVVRNFGVEIKQLWKGAENQFGVLNSVFEDESGTEDMDPGGGSDFETIEKPGEPSDPGDSDDDNDCAERLAAMQQEYGAEMNRLNAALNSAQAAYDDAMETRRTYRSRGRWGGYWSMTYVHPPEVRQAAQDRLDEAQLNLDDFQADWQARYDQLQSECGGD